MKQLSIKSMTALLLLCSISFFSCNDQKAPKAKFDTVSVNSCLLACATKEKDCWDEFEKCKATAYAEEQTALNSCSHVPPDNRWECRSKAEAESRNKIDQCLRNLKACLGKLASCREACVNQLTFDEDKTK